MTVSIRSVRLAYWLGARTAPQHMTDIAIEVDGIERVLWWPIASRKVRA